MKAKVVVYACLSLLVVLVAVPRASCQIDQYQYFGSEIPMDGLANLSIGSSTSQLNAQAVDFRFTALQTSSITSVQGYMFTNPNVSGKTCDYACGTGGTIIVQVLEDDGSSNHLPDNPSQVQPLGTASLAHPVGANDFYTFTFSPAIPVSAGTIYHLVWTDPTAYGKEGDTSSSFISVETIYSASQTLPLAITKDQLSTVELPPGASWSSGWVELTPESSGNIYQPIMSLVYQSGGSQGLGYYQVGQSAYARHIGGSDAIREVFTMPSNNVSVSGVTVRLSLSSGSTELHAHLETATGTTIDDCYIPASSFGSSPQYASCNFGTSHTLAAGQTYHIDFESDSGTVYVAYPMENGAKGTPAYGSGTTFPYGHAEYETSGSWQIADGNGGNCTCWDWQFYFNVD